jgi:hypothetical protein
MENKDIIKNKKIGMIIGAVSGAVFFILLFMQKEITGNWVYLFPVTVLFCLFSIGLISTGKLREGLKYVLYILGLFGIITLIWFLFKN